MVRCHRAEFVQREAVLAPAAARPPAWQERVADEDAVLAVSGVSASYGSTRVLHDVDLTVRKAPASRSSANQAAARRPSRAASRAARGHRDRGALL